MKYDVSSYGSGRRGGANFILKTIFYSTAIVSKDANFVAEHGRQQGSFDNTNEFLQGLGHTGTKS